VDGIKPTPTVCGAKPNSLLCLRQQITPVTFSVFGLSRLMLGLELLGAVVWV
jgi:hypothetical protein